MKFLSCLVLIALAALVESSVIKAAGGRKTTWQAQTHGKKSKTGHNPTAPSNKKAHLYKRDLLENLSKLPPLGDMPGLPDSQNLLVGGGRLAVAELVPNLGKKSLLEQAPIPALEALSATPEIGSELVKEGEKLAGKLEKRHVLKNLPNLGGLPGLPSIGRKLVNGARLHPKLGKRSLIGTPGFPDSGVLDSAGLSLGDLSGLSLGGLPGLPEIGSELVTEAEHLAGGLLPKLGKRSLVGLPDLPDTEVLDSAGLSLGDLSGLSLGGLPGLPEIGSELVKEGEDLAGELLPREKRNVLGGLPGLPLGGLNVLPKIGSKLVKEAEHLAGGHLPKLGKRSLIGIPGFPDTGLFDIDPRKSELLKEGKHLVGELFPKLGKRSLIGIPGFPDSGLFDADPRKSELLKKARTLAIDLLPKLGMSDLLAELPKDVDEDGNLLGLITKPLKGDLFGSAIKKGKNLVSHILPPLIKRDVDDSFSSQVQGIVSTISKAVKGVHQPQSQGNPSANQAKGNVGKREADASFVSAADKLLSPGMKLVNDISNDAVDVFLPFLKKS